MAKEKDYISLKEAAKISGYSADYIGQLIRGGKLSGKQVFSNVAWVTTEDAIIEYIQKEKKTKPHAHASSSKLEDVMVSAQTLARTYAIVAWAAIALLGLFILFLVGVFAISLDHRVSDNYLQEATNDSTQ